jgi:Flp pilus assembly pilin Flp
VNRSGRVHRRESGAAAVEFALVTPFLLLIVFGIITFGIIVAQELALGNAARQGARFGVVANGTCGDIVTETRNNAVSLGMGSTDIDVAVTRGGSFTCTDSAQIPCDGSDVDESVEVVASFESEPLVPMILVDDVDLSGTGRFRCEFS